MTFTHESTASVPVALSHIEGGFFFSFFLHMGACERARRASRLDTRDATERNGNKRVIMVAPGLATADAETYGSTMLDSFKIDISHQEMERIIVELELIWKTQPGEWLPIHVRYLPARRAARATSRRPHTRLYIERASFLDTRVDVSSASSRCPVPGRTFFSLASREGQSFSFFPTSTSRRRRRHQTSPRHPGRGKKNQKNQKHSTPPTLRRASFPPPRTPVILFEHTQGIANMLASELGYEDQEEFEDALKTDFTTFIGNLPHIEVC